MGFRAILNFRKFKVALNPFAEDSVSSVRWPTSALRIPNDTPNSKPYSEFLNLTPNSKSSLRIQKSHSEFKNLTPNSKSSLRIQKAHSEFKNLTPKS